jgi:opacity protein-like surface antigen
VRSAARPVSVNGKIVGTATPATHLVIAANPGANEIGSAGSGRGSISLTTSLGAATVAHSISMSGSPEFRFCLRPTDRRVAPTRKLAEVGSVPVLSPSATSRSVATSGAEPRDTQQPGSESPEAFYDKHAVAVILKGGAYKISEETHVTDTVPTLIEEKSTSTWGLEVEWRHPKGFAVGGEIFSFRNKWEDLFGYAGDVTTYTYTVNGKYYLGIGRIVYPYVGIGVGVALSNFSGTQAGTGFTYEDTYAGLAYQGLVGIEFRFKYVGINLQYKYLAADVETELLDGTTETNKMGGTGQLLGLTLHIPLR